MARLFVSHLVHWEDLVSPAHYMSTMLTLSRGVRWEPFLVTLALHGVGRR